MGAASSVALGGAVHIGCVVPPQTRIPIGWIAVGDPARLYPPGEADSIRAGLEEAGGFLPFVFGTDRTAAAASRCAPPCAATPATWPAPTRPTSPPARKDGAMRIAVTGASGRIGGEVVRLLAAQQHQVVALTRRPPGAVPGPAGAEARQADYADEQALAAALSEMARWSWSPAMARWRT